MTIPAKLQSYMACGMPIIAAAGGETARVISEAKCGVVSKLRNAEALSNLTQELRGKTMEERMTMKKNARKYYEKYFGRPELLNIMDNFLNSQI